MGEQGSDPDLAEPPGTNYIKPFLANLMEQLNYDNILKLLKSFLSFSEALILCRL